METNQRWVTIRPEVWKPEQIGDQITGVLVSKIAKDNKGKIGARYFIRNKTGEHIAWGSSVLDNKMQFVDVGQDVKIVFDGKSKIDNGKKLNLFTVSVSKPGADDSSKDNGANPIKEETVFE